MPDQTKGQKKQNNGSRGPSFWPNCALRINRSANTPWTGLCWPLGWEPGDTGKWLLKKKQEGDKGGSQDLQECDRIHHTLGVTASELGPCPEQWLAPLTTPAKIQLSCKQPSVANERTPVRRLMHGFHYMKSCKNSFSKEKKQNSTLIASRTSTSELKVLNSIKILSWQKQKKQNPNQLVVSSPTFHGSSALERGT